MLMPHFSHLEANSFLKIKSRLSVGKGPAPVPFENFDENFYRSEVPD